MSKPIKPKYEVISLDSAEITVDVSLLGKNSEIYFNATQIAKPFGKQPAHFLSLESTKEYVQVIEDERQSNYKESYNKNLPDLVTVRRGKYGGTWLHNELAFEFAGWCSPLFRRKLHKWAESRLMREYDWQQKRLESKTGFRPMTDAVMLAHDPVMGYHYSNEADLINLVMTGMKAKKFKELHGVDSVRDSLSASQLDEVARLQIINTGLIEVGMDYKVRREELTKCHRRKLSRDSSSIQGLVT